GAALREAVDAYHATRRHPDLPTFTIHPAQGVQAWWGSPESARPGCYVYFDAAGQILYVGKASMGASLGSRMAAHDHAEPRAWWRDAADFVVLVTVAEPFEAPSLEEYLIDVLGPPGNVLGLGAVRVAAGPP
ncbi:MAG: hypothetical protein ACRYGP_33030, partial [Janthinobacterium lividum]